jgi:hypothetical protein
VLREGVMTITEARAAAAVLLADESTSYVVRDVIEALLKALERRGR